MRYLLILMMAVTLFTTVANAKEKTMDNTSYEKATFAGGCFWCMEPFLEKLKGVISVTSGYTGGQTENPTYEEVSSGETGHAEAVEVVYDPKVVSYEKLLAVYWYNVDPTTLNKNFVDEGTQYRTAIYYHNDNQQRLAEKSKQELQASGRFKGEIVTEITKAGAFYPAEDYHQDFYKKNPGRYNSYSAFSGRKEFIKKTWGDENTQ